MMHSNSAPSFLSPEDIDDFLEWEKNKGTSKITLSKLKHFVFSFYEWSKTEGISKDSLLKWRGSLEEQGYSQVTIQNYIKGINRYLDYKNCPDLKFKKGKPKDLTGKSFGHLKVIEYTGRQNRKNFIWRCRCKCGKEIEVPAVSLISGNTNSCGCIKGEILKKANMYIGKTSLRQALDDKVKSSNSKSGFVGVTKKRTKWQAYITYKGKRFSLGVFDNLDDAVQARQTAKELVKEDAKKLLLLYDQARVDSLREFEESPHKTKK